MPHEDNLENSIAKVRQLVLDAITRQLVADVPVCTFLSGGLDSSAISAIAAQEFAKAGKGPLHTYSIDYAGNDVHFKANSFQPNSDAPWARKMSDFLGTSHHGIEISTQALADALKDAVIANDRPGMADIDSSLYLFCKEVKKDATVALSGECADEIFGGYPWFHRQECLTAQTFPWALANQDRVDLLSDEIRDWIKPQEYLQQKYIEAIEEVPRLAGETGLDAKIREIFYLNITRFMTTLLDRKDRMSMATGLEVRVPFCDHRLVEYVWNIPWSMKNIDNREKGILRRALQGILPEDIISRKKSPYPKTHNPEYLKTVRKTLLEVLDGSPLHHLLDKKTLQSILDSSDEFGFRPWFGQLMNKAQLYAYLYQVDTWFREYKISIS